MTHRILRTVRLKENAIGCCAFTPFALARSCGLRAVPSPPPDPFLAGRSTATNDPARTRPAPPAEIAGCGPAALRAHSPVAGVGSEGLRRTEGGRSAGSDGGEGVGNAAVRVGLAMAV
jgi:hypothetical protein